jgi:hypothetical protein
MVEEPISLHRAVQAQSLSPAPASHKSVPQIVFDRPELNRILALYGRMVAAGEWRDYALDFLEDVAVFSIFRRASEVPLLRIEKQPRLRARQGQYSVIAHGGAILKRGHDLAQVLKVFDRKLLKALAGE